MIIVTGSVVARDETVDKVQSLSLEHVHRSRAEPGCVSHDVHLDVENARRFVFVERWQDIDALRAHFGVKESRAFGRALVALAAEPPAMEIYDATPVTP